MQSWGQALKNVSITGYSHYSQLGTIVPVPQNLSIRQPRYLGSCLSRQQVIGRLMEVDWKTSPGGKVLLLMQLRRSVLAALRACSRIIGYLFHASRSSSTRNQQRSNLLATLSSSNKVQRELKSYSHPLVAIYQQR
jgi:hypothetical protein